MSYYFKLGQIPHKRHTQFRQPDGNLYHEELMGLRGFSGAKSLLYHLRPPTEVTTIAGSCPADLSFADQGPLRHRLLNTASLAPRGDAIEGRVPLMANQDVTLSVARPNEPMSYWYRYAHGDEAIFVHEGTGTFESQFGALKYGPGDYLVVPTGVIWRIVYSHHPLDVVGWDGHLWPFAFNIRDFEPITGRVHQPPPVHQTFEGPGFVVCSFVPRLFDYHPLSIPAPYNHSNVDSDEVIYYVEGDFMSRRGVGSASFTVHPNGIPHGPHPGTYEGSIGKTRTEELAVMVDTFRPLKLTTQAVTFEDEHYPMSWLRT
jgi:homogentisate 1,2-dioxygenase